MQGSPSCNMGRSTYNCMKYTQTKPCLYFGLKQEQRCYYRCQSDWYISAAIMENLKVEQSRG